MNIQMIDAPMGEGKAELFKETKSSSKLHEDAPTLASASMLVEVNISNWVGRKKDKRASEDVVTQNHAAAGVANVNKKLLADSDNLRAIQQHVTATRSAHAHMTMPWSNSGLRLLPTAQYFKYQQTMTDMQNEFERLITNFLDSYNDEVIDVQMKLGDLFSRDDYPTTDELERKFGFSINYMPLPDAGDFRIDIGNEQSQAMKEQYEGYYAKQLQNAMGDVWTRLHESLSNMSERLDYQSKDNKKTFRDTLVSNVEGMVGLLKTCNVTNDPKMEQARLVLDDALRGVTPDALREDDYLRSQTKQSVDEVIKSLPSINF